VWLLLGLLHLVVGVCGGVPVCSSPAWGVQCGVQQQTGQSSSVFCGFVVVSHPDAFEMEVVLDSLRFH
jgi:hypothetical protein